MKKFVIIFVFGLFLSIGIWENVWGQCPGCVTNMGCTSSPAKPTICPAVLPDGIAMQAYDQDLSFYLPANFDDEGSGYNVDLDQLDILNVVGLPFGLSFQTSASPVNIYYPTNNPPASEHGCGKICGTPIMPGTYTITVFVLAHVSVVSLGGLSQTSNSSFDIPITILPASASNNGFSISNPYGCAPLSTGFTSNRPSNGNPHYSYNWNFGNGNQSNSETPSAQNYSTPGNYTVTLHTTIDTLPYYFQSLTVNSGPNCNDDFMGIHGKPDFYFNLKLGTTTIYTNQSTYIDNTDSPVTFSFSPIELSNSSYKIEIWDYDSGLNGDNDACGNYYFNGNNAGTFTLTDGSNVITYTVSHPILNFDDVDTIRVYQSPIIGSLSFSPNDTLCKNDSVMLSITDTYGGIYQWYNDTNAINNANASTYYAKTNGKYWVEVSNSNGCRTNSSIKQITFIDNPSKPGTWVTGNTLNTNATGVALQWYFEGTEISGASGSTYNVTASGYYFVMATNWFGCATSSDTVYVTYSSGIAETDAINGIQLIPNPTTGKFIVSFDANSMDDIQVNVTDLTGRKVFKNNFGSTIGHFSQEIDLSNIQKGIYLVEIISGQSRANSKLIKQ